MIERVAATMEKYGMLRQGTRVGVAVSGGADSVFLLCALHQLGCAAAVLHVNHGLRGVASDGEEAFVRRLAGTVQLPIHVSRPVLGEGNVEQEARRARYAFFEDVLSQGGVDSVATGHTLDDQAETLLYRFLRGAGTAGLSGIRPVNGNIVRPLLELRRSDIRQWLEVKGQQWHEDCTNSNLDFARNRLRLEILPMIAEHLNPSLPQTLASTAAWAQSEEDYWSSEIDRLETALIEKRGEAVLLRNGPVLSLQTAAQRRLLRRAIERVRGSLRSIEFAHVERIREMMQTREGSGRLQLPGLDVFRSFDWLRLSPLGIDSVMDRNWRVQMKAPGRTEVPERRLTIDMELVNFPRVYNNQMNALDWDRCAGPLELRNWRPGDQYRTTRSPAAEKIKTLFQEHRVPLWERRDWPVIVRGGQQVEEIVWSRQFGAAHEFAAGPSTVRAATIHEIQVKESKAAFAASIDSVDDSAVNRAGETRRAKPGAEVL